jgi:prepilin-type N-terminal cleavage/methylation domain-containing protein
MRPGFTLIEVVASLFILSLAAVACVAILQTRRTGWDATAAMNAAPSAIAALQAAFDEEGPDALGKALASGTARRIAYVDAEAGMWRVLTADATLPAPDGPVFVATLSSPLAQGGGRALEFDVGLGWVTPWPAGAGQAEVTAALADPVPLCAYRCIVLKGGIVE